MDKIAAKSEWLWKVAFVLVAGGVPFLLKRIAGPLDVHVPDLLRNLSLGAGGVGSAFGLAIVVRELQHFVEEKFAAKRPSETRTRQH